MKFVLIYILIIINLNASLILVSNKDIQYKEVINNDNLQYLSSNKNTRCNLFDIELLKKDKYQAKHFIFKNKPICNKDVQKIVINKIQYDFGNILIQRDGKVIGENKKYIKIKNYDGKIEKIYKNGQE